jgi:hypothetical protein
LDEVHKIINMIIGSGHNATVAGVLRSSAATAGARHPRFCQPLGARSLVWTP